MTNWISLGSARDWWRNREPRQGQVRQAWPEIKALFDAGHSLKDIWVWLNEIGIEIGYARLSHYTGQLKRRDQAAAAADHSSTISDRGGPRDIPAPVSTDGAARERTTSDHAAEPAHDPLANIREREDRRPGFQYNSDPDIKKLI